MGKLGRKSKWLKETSDQSGFDNFNYDGTTWHKRWVGIKQRNLTIDPSEFDTPPPSNKPLGGADISGTPRADSLTTDVPPVAATVVQYVTAAGGIKLSQEPWIMVAGSNQAVIISANPQLPRGEAVQTATIECVGSGVTIIDGNGISLTGGNSFVMTSGSIINMIFNGTDNLWYETSRVQNGAF